MSSPSVYECPRCYLKRRNAARRDDVIRKARRDWGAVNGVCVGCEKITAMVTRPGRYADWPILPMPSVLRSFPEPDTERPT